MPDAAALDILNHFDFWSAVPLTGTATTASIAKHTNLPEEVVTRVLDHAKTLRIFTDASPGHIRHTSRSAALAQNAGLKALVSTILDDAGPPMTVMPQALEKFNVGSETLPEDMSRTAFNLFHGGKYANSWEYIENDGEGEKKGWRSRNFTTFMSYLKDIFRLEHIVDGSYGWGEAGDLSVVDVSPTHSPSHSQTQNTDTIYSHPTARRLSRSRRLRPRKEIPQPKNHSLRPPKGGVRLRRLPPRRP